MSSRPLNLQQVIDIITYVSEHSEPVLQQHLNPNGDEKDRSNLEWHFETLGDLNVVELSLMTEGDRVIPAIISLKPLGQDLVRLFTHKEALSQIKSQFGQEVNGSQLSTLVSVGSKILGDLVKPKVEKKAPRKKKSEKSQKGIKFGVARVRLLRYARNQIPADLKDVVRIPTRLGQKYLYIQNTDHEVVKRVVKWQFDGGVSVRVDWNNDVPGMSRVSYFDIAAPSDSYMEDLIEEEDVEKYLIDQESKISNNINLILTNEKSEVARLITAYRSEIQKGNSSNDDLLSDQGNFGDESLTDSVNSDEGSGESVPTEIPPEPASGQTDSLTAETSFDIGESTESTGGDEGLAPPESEPQQTPDAQQEETTEATETSEGTEETLDESLLKDLEDVQKAQEGFLNELTQQTARQDFAKQLEEEANEEPPAPPQTIENPLQIAELNSDSAHKGKDLLGFEQDVEAFAAIMALEKLTPPLAIALFGQWGTGKSFFMQKLSEKVDELAKYQGFLKEEDETGKEAKSSKQDEKPFCEGICQIHFNAWSYMDTNLWASLVTRIFEKLDDYINDNRSEAQKEVDTIKSGIAQQLDVAKGQIAELEARKAQVQNAIDTLTDQVETAQGELEGKIEEIKTSSRQEVIKEAIKASKIEESLKGMLDKAGISQEKLDQVNPELILKELKSGQTFVRQFLNYSGWDWGLVGVGVALLLITTLVLPEIASIETDWLNGIGSALAVLTGVLSKIRGTASKLSPLVNGVLKIKNDYDTAVSEAISKHEQEILAKQIEADQKEVELNQLNLQLKAKEAEIKEIEYKPDSVLAQKAMYNFITRKAASNDYSRHLGIISMIRKDFQTLSELFVESTKATKVPEKSKEKYQEFEKIRDGFDKPLQRIILYIDDLDRCPEERVVEVLEAVNLLMAFPLFVVVVGVDPRWVKNALIKKYHLQFTGHIKGADKAADSVGMEVINPSDYLEKIFQIPFHLKAPEDKSIKKMITHLLGDAVAERPQKEGEKETVAENQLPDMDLDAFFEEKSKEASGLTGEVAESLSETEEETAKASDLEVFDVGVPAMAPPEETEEEMEGAEEAGEEAEEPEESSEETAEDEIPEGLKVVTPDSLRLHWEEGEYMRNLSWLIGNTPRTVKRFVNMYRIIRAHEGLSYEDDESKKDLMIVMFILALRTGRYGEVSDKVLDIINIPHEGMSIDDWVNVEIEHHQLKIDKDLEKLKFDNEEEKRLEITRKQGEFDRTEYGKILNEIAFNQTLNELRTIPAKKLMKYVGFVKRFSFKIPE